MGAGSRSFIAALAFAMAPSLAAAQTWQFDGLGFIDGGGVRPISFSNALSADGSTVVGQSTNAEGQDEAFRWSGGAMQGLGFIDGGGATPYSTSIAVSADGAVIVGISLNASGNQEAFRWFGGVMQGLGFVDGGGATPFSFPSP